MYLSCVQNNFASIRLVTIIPIQVQLMYRPAARYGTYVRVVVYLLILTVFRVCVGVCVCIL